MIDLGSQKWRAALEHGLGATCLAGIEGELPLPVFRFARQSVAYVGFPVGATVSVVAEAYRRARESDVALLRILGRADQPAFPGTKHRYVQRGVILERLQSWTPTDFEKPRRTLNRSRRTAITVRRAAARDSNAIWRLYRQTVDRHGGVHRYSHEYFQILAEEGVLVAERGADVIGFVALAKLGHESFYLHGAHDPAARADYPSDLLFLQMILAAQAAGACSIDFLASPESQPALHHYKLAWGGRTCDIATDDVPLNLTGWAIATGYALKKRFSETIRASR